MTQKISVPVWFDDTGVFCQGALQGVGIDAVVVGYVDKPSGFTVPGATGPIPLQQTLFVKDKVLGGLYLNMTLEEWSEEVGKVSIAPSAWDGGDGILLQTNGASNSIQDKLNLINGTNTVVVYNGDGSVQINASGGGSATLNQNQIAYGSASNEVTSSSDLVYNTATSRFFAGFGGAKYLDISEDTQEIGDIGKISSGMKLRLFQASPKEWRGTISDNDGNYLLLDKIDNIFSLGDIDNSVNGTKLVIDDDNNNATFFSQGAEMLSLDVANRLYKIGDIDATNNGTKLVIDDANKLVILGDPDGIGAGGYISISNDNSGTYAAEIGTGAGSNLRISQLDKLYSFGDIDSVNNGTKLVIDDTNSNIKASAQGDNSLEIDGINNIARLKNSDLSFTIAGQGSPGESAAVINNNDGHTFFNVLPSGYYEFGDLTGTINGTRLTINDTTKTIIHATAVGSINIDLSNITAPRARTEPDKDGEYVVGTLFGDTLPLLGGTTTVNIIAATTSSNISITPIDNGIPIVSGNFSVIRNNGSFTIVDSTAGANDGLSFMYTFNNP